MTDLRVMPLAEAQAYFNRNADVTALEVYVDNPDKVDYYRKVIAEAAGRPIFMVDWRQRNASFFGALQVERNVMFLILTLTFWWRRSNRLRADHAGEGQGARIAILRTMGASQGSICASFSSPAPRSAWSARLSGSCLPCWCVSISSRSASSCPVHRDHLFDPALYFLSRLPAEVDVRETTAVVVMALTLSLLATLYPSWRAARLDPVEALRYE